jgi:voltage-gated potassium channel
MIAPSNTASRAVALTRAGTVAVVAALMAGYYLLPAGGRLSPGLWLAVFVAGLAVLGTLIVVAVRRLAASSPDTRLAGLICLLGLAVSFFSRSYCQLAQLPGQFTDLRTHTDALYFTVSTLSTVGFGDVHAAGQLARLAVTVQIVFDLVFIAAAAALITSMMQARAVRRGPGG